ncbi:class C beta-lactamase-related serine hydrolase [Nocardioides eburneiflavus]|uniref:Class C beta-lactamase-related serine hydrolase n=1 Tax=Nocardioides eburneiflavus TaxID=2518372 RepID=A0A4Z1CFM2_9ACTN|nr:serine hydrolase [Nocardioides eburneiflavus]TGN63807.1 class C beta-lactamase-related serine hydrolase [Nocardioides eburneiflavus]
MPASIVGSRLSGLRFSDPQDDPGWSHVVVPGTSGAALAAAARPIETEITGAGRTRGLDEWVEETWTTSLLVLDRGTVVHEWYADGLGPRTRFLGASMTKSALAHLVGRAVTDGDLALDDLIRVHVPELAGTGYDGTRVVDVLTMTSGVDWAEDHRDPGSLASRLLGCFADGGDSRALLDHVGPGTVAGTRYAYCTADSQVLDWVRERATGRTFSDDLTRLWADLGCADDACVGIDGRGVALAGGALAATARDWARLAMLAVDGTTPEGRRLLAGSWADEAARPAYPFTAPGRLPSTLTTHAGFGYHWWPLDAEGHRLVADGSRGQLAAVDRRTRAVVVKTSRWPYDDPWVDRQYRDLSYLGLHALLDAVEPRDGEPHTEGEARP